MVLLASMRLVAHAVFRPAQPHRPSLHTLYIPCTAPFCAPVTLPCSAQRASAAPRMYAGASCCLRPRPPGSSLPHAGPAGSVMHHTHAQPWPFAHTAPTASMIIIITACSTCCAAHSKAHVCTGTRERRMAAPRGVGRSLILAGHMPRPVLTRS